MDYTKNQMSYDRCFKYLNQIKEKPFTKIALVTEPPDFSHEQNIVELRKKYDLIQIPTLLTDELMLNEFNRYFNLKIDDPIETLRNLCNYEYYVEFSKRHAEYVFMKMANIPIYKTTVYHVPVQPIAYGEYFDHVLLLTNDGTIDSSDLESHASEEGFPADVELQLIHTQRKHFDLCHTLITSV